MVGDLVRQVYGDGPQSFQIKEFTEIGEAVGRVKEGKIKMVILDQVQITKDKISVLANEDLKQLHEICQASNALLVVDITRAYPDLLAEK